MSSENNVYRIGTKNMSNIHKKLYNACNRASSVVKADKNGAPFSPLLHDDVQRVAMAALLENGLYPTCNCRERKRNHRSRGHDRDAGVYES